MTTLRHTFEQSYRHHLLDLIHGQWAALGVPFTAGPDSEDRSVIDPEALLWCSLEFLPTEPRLEETVVEWLSENPHYVVRQRIIKTAKRGEGRTVLWQSLDRRNSKLGFTTEPSEPLHGLGSPSDVVEFGQRIAKRRRNDSGNPKRMGRIRNGSATVLLRARDLLGHDIRHFLIVYLLANPHGGTLRDIQNWSRYGRRSLSDAADRWKAVEIVTLERGYCRLIAPEPFEQLLQIKSSRIVLVNWWNVFETSVRLLRDLAKAREKGFDEESTITKSLKREAAEKLTDLAAPSERANSASVRRLLACFS